MSKIENRGGGQEDIKTIKVSFESIKTFKKAFN